MKITRGSYKKDGPQKLRITRALAVFGLHYKKPAHRKQRTGFWLAQEHQPHEILADVEKRYNVIIKQVHPDVPGGCAKTCAFINSVRDRIHFLFQRKGYLCE